MCQRDPSLEMWLDYRPQKTGRNNCRTSTKLSSSRCCNLS